MGMVQPCVHLISTSTRLSIDDEQGRGEKREDKIEQLKDMFPDILTLTAVVRRLIWETGSS